jgi:hypothetical protein
MISPITVLLPENSGMAGYPSANAVPDKYGFGQHSAAKECARLKSNDSGDGQPRIPHDVPVINRLLLEAL